MIIKGMQWGRVCGGTDPTTLVVEVMFEKNGSNIFIVDSLSAALLEHIIVSENTLFDKISDNTLKDIEKLKDSSIKYLESPYDEVEAALESDKEINKSGYMNAIRFCRYAMDMLDWDDKNSATGKFVFSLFIGEDVNGLNMPYPRVHNWKKGF